MAIKRGDVYYADLGQPVGSEQGGVRPVIIIQNNTGNAYSPTVIIASCTTKNKTALPTHKNVTMKELKEPSVILFEQIRCIDKRRLKEYVGHYNGNFDNEIKISLGL